MSVLPKLNLLVANFLAPSTRIAPVLVCRYTPFNPPDRKSETIEIKRNRLLYESRKRGNLENGIILSSFADKHLSKMDEKQLEAYDKLINGPDCDWDIFYWTTGEKEAPEEFKSDVLELLKKHAKNYGRELRNQQPAIRPPNQ
ncbi:unnamed protein product [Mesocestoides corti]|uniref:Succinate dehydrogenase assembly factor 2, mitochondrial n=1 Tax=Mesocestoides corti TaxID=53468 RepID=A0A0R3UG22_MESCO|nr:unnamed protein product [Mesocestoides corti]